MLGPASWCGGVAEGLTRRGGEAAAALEDVDVVDHVSLESDGTQMGDLWVPVNSGHAIMVPLSKLMVEKNPTSYLSVSAISNSL